MKAESKRRVLGKGLGSLIPDAPGGDPLAGTAAAVAGGPVEIKLAEIKPNPHQPRQTFDASEIESLAESIRTSGLLQPLIVRRERNGGYTLVAGERRLRAARHAGLERVPVVVRDVADDRLLEYALIENLQRDDLRPIETAKAFRLLIRRFGLTQAEVSSRLGKPRSTVANFLRLLDLADDVQKLLESASLSMGHGRALAALEDLAMQVRLGRTAVRDGWSVRQLEEQVRRATEVRKAKPKKAARRDPNVAAAEETLSRTLAAKVSINQLQSGRGRIEIRFANGEDLDRLYRALIRSSGNES